MVTYKNLLSDVWILGVTNTYTWMFWTFVSFFKIDNL